MNNKYMKDYDKNKESSYIKYWHVNNLYGWAMSQKLPVNNFEWIEDTSQFNEDFRFLEADVQYPEKLHELHDDLPFLPKRMKIEKAKKLVTNLHDKTEYVVYIRNLKHELNYGLFLKKVRRVIIINQKVFLESDIDRNTKLRKKGKNNFEKDFFKLMNNVVFGKTMENVIQHRNIELATTERRRNDLVSEPNYYTTKLFTENLLATEMRKTQILINKPIYLGLSILDLSEIVMYEFWYDYVKKKIWRKCKNLLYEYRQLHCLYKSRRYL